MASAAQGAGKAPATVNTYPLVRRNYTTVGSRAMNVVFWTSVVSTIITAVGFFYSLAHIDLSGMQSYGIACAVSAIVAGGSLFLHEKLKKKKVEQCTREELVKVCARNIESTTVKRTLSSAASHSSWYTVMMGVAVIAALVLIGDYASWQISGKSLLGNAHAIIHHVSAALAFVLLLAVKEFKQHLKKIPGNEAVDILDRMKTELEGLEELAAASSGRKAMLEKALKQVNALRDEISPPVRPQF